MKQTPIYGTAAEIVRVYKMKPECTCCGRDLTGHAVRWLELDQRTWTYHDFADVPEAQSQGWFPFGLTCARKLVAKETKRRAETSHNKAAKN